MKKISIKFLAESAIIAALYVALTWILAPISYGSIQFRVSEILVLLVVLNPKYSFALIIGCFISNTTSSLGWYDMVFGTLATTLAIIPMCFIKKLPIAAIFPVISNAIIVSLELGLAFDLWGAAFAYDVLTVGFGELVVLYALGIPAMHGIAKNEYLVEQMELDTTHMKEYSFITIPNMTMIFLGVLGIILFVAYPFYTEIIEDEAVNHSAMSVFLNNPYTILFVLCSILFGCMVFVKNKWFRLAGLSVAVVGILVAYILIGIQNPACFAYVYYYGYVVYIALLVLAAVLLTTKETKEYTSLEEVEA